MIGNTPIEKHLKNALTLSDSLAWFDANTHWLQKTIVKMIKFDQLEKQGVDKFNQIIGTYSPVTQQIDPTKVAGTPYTLFDTGKFYRSMLVTVLQNSILISADPHKMTDQKWWSTNILGLNEQNLEIYKTRIRENYIRYARKKLGIN